MSASTVPEPQPPNEAAARSERFIGFALLAGIVTAVIVLGLLYWLAHEMLEGETAQFDSAVRGAVHSLASGPMTALMRGASRYGSPVFLGVVGLLIAGYFFWRDWRRAAVLLVATMLGAVLLDTMLKFSFQRARPTAFFDYPLPTSFSFPSGHSMFGFCFFFALALLASPRVNRAGIRIAIWTVAIVASFIIGVSRIYLGVHYPSDVVAGWGAGFVWVMLVAFSDRVAHRMKHGTA